MWRVTFPLLCCASVDTIIIFQLSPVAKEISYYSAQETCDKNSAAIDEFEYEALQSKLKFVNLKQVGLRTRLN